jgi:hypothetical protein
MRTTVILLILAALGTLLWLFFQEAWTREDAGSEPTGKEDVATTLPEMLRDAKLLWKERAVRCSTPVSLHGTLDEAFVDRSGTMILSETKLRRLKRVYASDVLQLSAYKLALEGEGKRVAGKGFVRVITPGGNEYKVVTLMSADEVIAARKLHGDLVRGRSTGAKCNVESVCRSCEYKKPCGEMQ